MLIRKMSLSVIFFTLTLINLNAQQHLDPEYIKVTNDRASKIVDKLELSDSVKIQAVIKLIAQQYRDLSMYHDAKDTNIDALKKSDVSKEKQIKEIVKLRKKTDKKIGKLHKTYLKNLAKYLTTDKIDAVKDGMTYGVVPKTYFAFQDMLPNLTEAQKEFIYKNLVEAREHAMDAGSSKEKHAWFGKYKGRINNYLSKEGYDLNKESEDWHKRIEARKKESAQ